MINKFIVAAGVAIIAISCSSTASFAKKPSKQKEAKCNVGAACTKKLDKTGKVTGWANWKACASNGKMYTTVFPCYARGGMCPPQTCPDEKKKGKKGKHK